MDPIVAQNIAFSFVVFRKAVDRADKITKIARSFDLLVNTNRIDNLGKHDIPAKQSLKFCLVADSCSFSGMLRQSIAAIFPQR